jgi:drug/metabolite transporter (DMT)-like permease
MQNHAKGTLYAVITALFWGVLAIALKVADPLASPTTIVWLRFVVAFSVLACWQAFKEPESFKILARPPILLIVATIALCWNYIGFMLGLHFTTPGNAQLFIQVGPILLAVVGLTLYKEPIGRFQVIGFILAVAGLVVFYKDQLNNSGHGINYTKGILLTLSAAVAWAVYASLQKKLVSKYTPHTLNLFLFGLPVIVYLPFINLAPLLHLQWYWWPLLVFLGLNTLFAYIYVAAALKYTDASKVSIILILNPLITFILMGVLEALDVSWIKAENFTLLSVAGALTVIGGAILVVRKKRVKPISSTPSNSNKNFQNPTDS